MLLLSIPARFEFRRKELSRGEKCRNRNTNAESWQLAPFRVGIKK